jgi:hypothetical protein
MFIRYQSTDTHCSHTACCASTLCTARCCITVKSLCSGVVASWPLQSRFKWPSGPASLLQHHRLSVGHRRRLLLLSTVPFWPNGRRSIPRRATAWTVSESTRTRPHHWKYREDSGSQPPADSDCGWCATGQGCRANKRDAESQLQVRIFQFSEHLFTTL